MELVDLLRPNRVAAGLKAPNKKQLLEHLARWAGREIDYAPGPIFEAVMQRERLGTTGVGPGVADPHARHADVGEAAGFFARLSPPVDFLAIDDEPVDLVFLLLTPQEAGVEHLKSLANVSRALRDPGMCARLRGAETADALYAVLIGSARSFAA
jgi:PTS system nitrogen regulatory IIA component